MVIVLIVIDESFFVENVFDCKYYNIWLCLDCMDVKYGKFFYCRIIWCIFMLF